MLGLADVDVDIDGLAALADDHASVDFFTGADKELAAFLRAEQAVSDGRARLERDEGSLLAVGDVAFIRGIAVEDRVHDPVALRICQEVAPVADEASRRDRELQSCVAAVPDLHVEEFALALAELLDHGPGEFLGDIDEAGFHGLQELSVRVALVDDFRFCDREFISLAAHSLDEDREVELAASGDLKGFRGIGVLHAQGDIRVELPVEPVPQMAARHILAVFAGERGVVDGEGHGDRGLRDLLERDRLGSIGRTERIADMEVRNSRDSYDRADLRLLDFHAAQAFKFI